MYVIGEVESHWKWTSINYNDPITIGMMQNYAYNAARLLSKIQAQNPSDWAALQLAAPTLTDDVINHPTSEVDFWTTRYLTQSEGNALIQILGTEATKAIQQEMWNEDGTRYVGVLSGWGMGEPHPKELIFTMAMYHQSPRRAGDVIRTCGGTADLQKIYTTCLNNTVLGQYRSRYTTVYNRLTAWDGISLPPDFGQSTLPPSNDGGDTPTIETTPSELGYIIQTGNDLILFGSGAYQNGVVFHAAAGNRWICATKPDETPITGTNNNDGSDTGATAEQNLVAKMLSLVGTLKYSQAAGRLTPEVSGYSDCSGTCWYVYKTVTGIDPGTWTGQMVQRGTSIFDGNPSNLNESIMRLGDLVLYWWPNDSDPDVTDHVEMYIGNGQVCGHGGGMGPTVKNSIGRGAPRINVRRYL